ncbi:MAG TPA: DoxX family protein [Vicinamibacterales bacterium]|jgi:putative oxidoreductase|nr:DoxX family protein [Vicinamibacterales bacterium]
MTTAASRAFERANPSATFDAVVPFVGRALLAVLFLTAVVGKLQAPAGTIGFIASVGLPSPRLAYALAVLIELVGGLALLAGYRTRIAAGALAIFSLATAIGFHSNFADMDQFIHFFKNIAITGGLLQVVAFGAGTFSLDAYRQSRIRTS